MGDQRGDPVVVAIAQLVTGNGVVLVDDRDAAQFDQAYQRLAGMEVLPAIDEVVRDQQHLRGNQVVPSQ